MKLNWKCPRSWMHASFARALTAGLLLCLGGAATAGTTTFTTSGTWTCPAGVTAVTVECYGGGGAGGAAINGGTSGAGGGGGAGGSYAMSTVTVVPTHVYNVTVGTGGTSASGVSSAGTVSSFVNVSDSVNVVGQGGAAGVSVNGTTVPNSGGSGSSVSSIGTTLYAGGSGAAGTASGGGGGGGSAGSVSAGNNGSSSTAGAAVTGGGAGGAGKTALGSGAAGSFGAGGGGAYSKSSAVQENGGAGGPGAVIVTPATVAFTQGNLVVERLGDGTIETLASSGNTMYMDEFTTAGAAVQSMKIANTGTSALVDDGTASTGGGMTRSPDGQVLCFPGYNIAEPYSASISAATSIAVPRGIGTINYNGTYQLAASSSTFYSATTIRGATTDDNGNYWTCGGAAGTTTPVGGICYWGTGNTPVCLTNGTYRQVFVFGNNLWFDVQNSSYNDNLGAFEYSGEPTALPATATAVFTSSGSSTYGLSVNNAANPTVLYFADGSAGIVKWTKSGATWSQAYVVYSTATFGLTVDWTTTPATIYATTTGSGNKLIKVVDNGAGSTVTTLATAGTKQIFRGVAFAPVAATYTLTYNGNGSTGGTVPVDSSSPYSPGATVTVLGNAGSLAQTGYTFAGWNTAANGTGTAYAPGATFTISANTTLYAQWTINTYTVAYNGNGNDGGSAPVGGTYNYDTSLTVSGAGSLTLTGETFAGWNTAANGSGTAYAVGATLTVVANTMLYAQWTANPILTVGSGSLSFGGVAVNGTSASQSYTVSGANLTGNLVITAPANFQISASSGTGYGSSLTLTPAAGTVASTTIYVQFDPTALTSYSGTSIANTSSGATEQDVAVSGFGATAPSVTTAAATSINSNSAALNGTVTASNNAVITDCGFYYQTTAGVTTSGTKLSAGGTAQSAFSTSATGLSPNQTYYYRAYAQNAVGLILDASGDTSFTTLPNIPVAPVLSAETVNSISVALGSGDGNPASTPYAIYETTQGKYVQSANGSLNTTADFETAATWGTTTVTGLAPGHAYNFKVEAQNSAGVATVFGAAATASTLSVSFTPGNLVVERLGDGTETLSADGNTMFMDEFTTNAMAVQSIEIANAGASALIDDGTASTGGGMTRSPDGQVLCFPGYNTPEPYSSSLSSAASTAVPRGIGIINSNGVYQLAASSTAFYSGTTIRGATTDDNGNFWTSGGLAGASPAVGGICYWGTNSAAACITNGTYRQVFMFGNNLWFDVQNSSAGYNLGAYEFSGEPATASATPTQVFTSSGSSTYGLSINNAANPTVLYFADGSAGIIKWTNSASGTWSQAYVVYSTATFGLTVDWTTTPATIYATTTGAANKLIRVVDNGAGSTATTLATAGSKQIFRGVAFAPAPLTYAVTYSGNGSTGGTVPVDSSSPYSPGATVTVLGNAGSLAQTGYTFAGWNTAANGTGTAYAPGATFTISANTTLYAQWTINTYTVAYNGNGNDGGSAPVGGTYNYDTSLTVSGAGSLTLTGETFAGWNTAANGSGTAYAVGATLTVVANTMLYAQWTANPILTVGSGSLSFGGVAVNGTSASQSYTVSGANLTGNLVITAPANFQISASSGTGYGSSLTLTPAAGTVASTTIYVQFDPTALTSYSGTSIANTSSGATEQDVAVSGFGATAPSVTTAAATSINSNSAALNGTVTASNNAVITDCGFYYQTTAGVTTSGTKLSAGGTAQSAFSTSATGLSPNQTYYYRAYAQNAVGLTLDASGDTSFTTLPNTPASPVVSAETTNSVAVALGSGDGNPASTPYAIYETTQGKYVQSANGSLNTTADFETAATWGTTTVTGLAPGHTYNFEVEAQNSAGVATVFGAAATASTLSVPFTPGNLVVERLGDGTQALSADGNVIFFDEYTTTGAGQGPVNTVEITPNGPTSLIDSGTEDVDGGLSLSPNGQWLCFAGYQTNYGFSSTIYSSSSASVLRGVGTVNASGVYQLAATTTNYTIETIRSAATDGNGNFWTSGDAGGGGIDYLGNNNAAAHLQTGDYRDVIVLGTNLWCDVQNSGGTYSDGIYEFSGTPTGAATATLIFQSSTISPYGLSINNLTNPTVIYYADDGAGIVKLTNNGSGTWMQAYVVYASAVFGLTVDWTTTPATLYATTGKGTAGNSLISVPDNGAGSTATTNATATAKEILRGVAFTPVAVTATNNSPAVATVATLSCSAIPGATYSWTGPNNFASSAQNPTVASSASSAINGLYTATISWDNGLYNASANTTLSLPVSTVPVISGMATALPFTTTYGAPSPAQGFAVSGSNLTANLLATAPAGLEVSSDGTTFAATATFIPSSGTASGTLYVRLAANAAVSGAYNAQNVLLTSSGATTVNITTAASGNTVAPAELTITGVTGSNKTYNGNTSAALTGTPAYSGLVNGDSFGVSGTPTASFSTANVGNGITITISGYTAPSANYVITEPTLSANITPCLLTVTAQPNSKTYDGGTSAAARPVITSGSLQGTDTASFIEAYNQAAAGTGIMLIPSGTINDGNGGHNYSVTFVDNTGVIYKAAVTVAWNTPAAITAGTALSASQLDATASVPGTFTYTPSAGTVPAAGTDLLSVVFVPADAIDYSDASDSVTLTVTAKATATPTDEPLFPAWGIPAMLLGMAACGAYFVRRQTMVSNH